MPYDGQTRVRDGHTEVYEADLGEWVRVSVSVPRPKARILAKPAHEDREAPDDAPGDGPKR